MKKYKWSKEHPEFTPDFTPKEMLELGVFEGKYINGMKDEIPKSWLKKAKIVGRKDDPDPTLNYFRVKARMSLSEWKKRGWMHKQDPLGWFQWYIRFYQGRRTEDDVRQIKRWVSFKGRHSQQVINGKRKGDATYRPKQRQALLQWGVNSIVL